MNQIDLLLNNNTYPVSEITMNSSYNWYVNTNFGLSNILSLKIISNTAEELNTLFNDLHQNIYGKVLTFLVKQNSNTYKCNLTNYAVSNMVMNQGIDKPFIELELFYDKAELLNNQRVGLFKE